MDIVRVLPNKIVGIGEECGMGGIFSPHYSRGFPNYNSRVAILKLLFLPDIFLIHIKRDPPKVERCNTALSLCGESSAIVNGSASINVNTTRPSMQGSSTYRIDRTCASHSVKPPVNLG